MQRLTSVLTRVSGLALVVVLGQVPALLGPLPAVGAPGGAFDTIAARAAPDRPDPVGEWPLRPQPEVVAGFDPPDDPWGAGHRGVDLLGAAGARVHAALPGRVSFAGLLAGRGVVVVGHGATRTTYEPVEAGVRVGDSVAAGDPLGRLALPGSHCFPRACLHWGWLRGETYLDPLALVGGGPVRLMPLWRADPVALSRSWAPARPAYPGWRPAVEAARATRTSGAQARGCACW
jgi:murein DD-endopeptidase MepM/ murein hydrolase activator NlpD